jgi:hypothetical protein
MVAAVVRAIAFVPGHAFAADLAARRKIVY